MSFDLFSQQQTLLSRLSPHAGAIVIADTFSPVDLTVEGAATVGAQLQFVEFSPVGQSGTSALHHARWSFDLYVDTGRAGTADKTAACALFSNALAALIGWVVWKLFFAEHAAQQKHDQAAAHAQAVVGQAEGSAGAAAANKVAESAARETIIHEITRDHYAEITKQPGADDPVPDAVWDAFVRSVCVRASAARLPDCQRLSKADP